MAVGSEDHEVLDVRAVEFDRPVNQILEARDACRNAHANGARHAGLFACGDLVRGQRTAGAIVFFDTLLSLRLELLRRAVAVVRAFLRDETRRHRAIAIETFGLKVRRVRAVDLGALVPVETQPPHTVEDPLDHFRRRSLDVRVLDAKDQCAAEAAGKEPVEERGSSTSDVEIAGGRRSKANARDHDNWMGGLPAVARSATNERSRPAGRSSLSEAGLPAEARSQPPSEVGLPTEARSSSRRAKVGEAGIRTLGTAFRPYNGLANRRLQPLGHLTALNYRRFQRAAMGFILMAASPIIACPTIAQRREAPSIDQWNAPSRIIGSAS